MSAPYGQDPYEPTQRFSAPQQHPPNQPPHRGVGTGVYVDWTRYAIGTLMTALVVFGVGGIMTTLVNSIFSRIGMSVQWYRPYTSWVLNASLGAGMTIIAAGLLALLIVGMPKGTANGFFIGLGALAIISVTILPLLVQSNWQAALGDCLIWGPMGVTILLLLTYIATPPTVRYEAN